MNTSIIVLVPFDFGNNHATAPAVGIVHACLTLILILCSVLSDRETELLLTSAL